MYKIANTANPGSNPAVRRADAMQMFYKNNRGFNIMNPGSVGQSQRSPLWYQRHGGNGSANRPGAANPPSTPTAPSQWTFQPNPLDQPPAGQPPAPGNAGQAQGQNPWAYSPPIQPWMFNPMGGGGGQWGSWNNIGMPPQTGGGLPPYQPQPGGNMTIGNNFHQAQVPQRDFSQFHRMPTAVDPSWGTPSNELPGYSSQPPQTGGQLPPYSGNIFNTVPTMQSGSPYSGQPWRQL